MKFWEYDIMPGQKKNVKIAVPGGEDLDLIVICGKRPGKTMVINNNAEYGKRKKETTWKIACLVKGLTTMKSLTAS